MREIVNPFNIIKPGAELAVASNETDKGELSTASALSNMNPSICPKCGGSMCTAFLYNKTPVFYCDPCRVTHPKE